MAEAGGRKDFLRDTQEGMVYLAEQTGGFAVLNTNDLAWGLARITNDVRDYYVIGYTPSEGTFARAGGRSLHSTRSRSRSRGPGCASKPGRSSSVLPTRRTAGRRARRHNNSSTPRLRRLPRPTLRSARRPCPGISPEQRPLRARAPAHRRTAADVRCH